MTTAPVVPATPRDDSVIWMSFATVGTMAVLAIVFGMSAATFIYVCVLAIPVSWCARLLLRHDTTEWLGKMVLYR